MRVSSQNDWETNKAITYLFFNFCVVESHFVRPLLLYDQGKSPVNTGNRENRANDWRSGACWDDSCQTSPQCLSKLLGQITQKNKY